MNIDQYREMIAAEAKAGTETPIVEQTPTTPVVESVVEPVVETKPNETKIVVDGEEITPEQVKEFKAGYLRTQDYTKKTQETAKQRRENDAAIRFYESVKQNPQLVQQLGITLPESDPNVGRMTDLEDQLVQREVDLLSMKYQDFDVREALELASTKPGLNLEDAYLLGKSRKPVVPPAVQTPLDIEEVKKQIREDLLKEFEASQTATQSIITSNDTVTPTKSADDIQLTDAQLEYCRKSKTNPEEYKNMIKQMTKR